MTYFTVSKALGDISENKFACFGEVHGADEQLGLCS